MKTENFEGIISQLVQSKCKKSNKPTEPNRSKHSIRWDRSYNFKWRQTENSDRKTRSKRIFQWKMNQWRLLLKRKKKATQKLSHYVKEKEFVGKLTDILLMKMTSILRNEIELFSKYWNYVMKLMPGSRQMAKISSKLRKIRRSLDQREVPLTRKSSFNLIGNFQQPLDLLNYMPRQRSSPDYRNCMAVANSKITTIEEFIKGFDFIKRVWKWSVLRFEMKSIECESFARRNIELLLKNLDLGGMDEVSLKRWTLKNARQYAKFKSSSQSIVNIITSFTYRSKNPWDL